MELTNNTVDFSAYADGDLVAAVMEQSVAYSLVMPSDLKKLAPTRDLDAVRAVVCTIAIAGDAYMYVVTKNKRAKLMMSHEVLTHALAVGGDVQPIIELKAPLITKEDAVVNDVVLKVGGLPMEALVAHEDLVVNSRTPIKGTGVAIKFEGKVYCGPTVNGEPVFESLGTQFLKDLNLETTLIRSKEIIVGHVVVDLVKLSKGHFQPKKVPAKLGVFSKDDREYIDKLIVDIVKIFGAGVVSKGSQKGRVLLKTIFDLMVISRNKPGYDDFIKKISDWATRTRNVLLPNKLGDYGMQDLQYARSVLQFTRGVRGGDEAESTSIGLSTYMDFNIDRAIVKYLARAKDITRILTMCGQQEAVTFVGKAATAYVDALLMINANIKLIGTPRPQQPGWEMDSKTRTWVNTKYKARLTLEHVGLEFNTDIYDPKDDKTDTFNYEGVQMVECPVDMGNGRYVPSCLVHNLTGWLLPLHYAQKKKSVYKLDKNYLKIVNIVNVTRMYPSLFPADRAVTILRKHAYPVIDFSYYKRLAVTARAEGFMTLFVSAGMDSDMALLEHLDAEQVALIAAAVQSKKYDREEDQQFGTVLVDTDDEALTEDKSATGVGTEVPDDF